MRITLSIDATLMNEAERAANEIGVSRSRLFSMAMRSYLKQRRGEAITKALDPVYARGQTPEDNRIVVGIKARLLSIVREPY